MPLDGSRPLHQKRSFTDSDSPIAVLHDLLLDRLLTPLPMTTLVAEPFFGCNRRDPKGTAFFAFFFLFLTRFTKCGIFLAMRAPPFN